MEEGRTRRSVFGFEVSLTAAVAIEGGDARVAREGLLAAIDGASATLVVGPGAGLVLTALRPSDEVRLVSVDGVNPTAELAEALRAFWSTRRPP